MPDPYQFWLNNQQKKTTDPYDFYLKQQGKVSPYDFYMSRQYGYPSLTDEEKARAVAMTGRELLEQRETPGFLGAFTSGLKSGASLGWMHDEPVSPESMTLGETVAGISGELLGGLVPLSIASMFTGGVGTPVAGAKYMSGVYSAFNKLGKAKNVIGVYGKHLANIEKQAKKLTGSADFLYSGKAAGGVQSQLAKRYGSIKSRMKVAESQRLASEQVIRQAQREYTSSLVDKGAKKQLQRISKLMAKSPGGIVGPRPYGKILGNWKGYRTKVIEPLAKKFGYKGAAIADRFANSALAFASVGLVSNKPGASLVDRAADIPKDVFLGMMFAAAGTPTLLGKSWGGKMEPVALMGIGSYQDYLSFRPEPNMDIRDRLLHGLTLTAFHYVGHGLSNIAVKEKMFKGLIQTGFDEPVAYEMAFKSKFSNKTVAEARNMWQKRGVLYHNKKNPKDVIFVKEFKGEAAAKGVAEGENKGFITYQHLNTEETGSFAGPTLRDARKKMNKKYTRVDFKNQKLVDDLPPEVRENVDSFMEGRKTDWDSLGGWKIAEPGTVEQKIGREIPRYETQERQAESEFYKSQRKDLEKVSQKNRVFDSEKDVVEFVDEKSLKKGDLVQWIRDGKEHFVGEKEGEFYPVKVESADSKFAYINVEKSDVPKHLLKDLIDGNKIPLSEIEIIKKSGGKRPVRYKLNLRYSNRTDGKHHRKIKETSWDDPKNLIFESREAAEQYAKEHWVGEFESNPTIESKIKILKAKENRIKNTPEYSEFGKERGILERSFNEKEFNADERIDIINSVWPHSKGKVENLTTREVRRVTDLVKGDAGETFEVFDNRVRLSPPNFIEKVSPPFWNFLKSVGKVTKDFILPQHTFLEMLGPAGAKASMTGIKPHSRTRQTVVGTSVSLHNGIRRDLKGTGVSFKELVSHIQAYLDPLYEPLQKTPEYIKFQEKMESITMKDSVGNRVNALDAMIDRYRKFYREMAVAQVSTWSWVRNASSKKLKREPFVKIYDKQGNKVKLVDVAKDEARHTEQVNSFLDWMEGNSRTVVDSNGRRVTVDGKKSKHHYLENYSRRQVTSEFFDFIHANTKGFDRVAAYMAKNDPSLKNMPFEDAFQQAKDFMKDLQQIHGDRNIYGQQYTRVAELPAYIYVTEGKSGWGDIAPLLRGKEFKENGKSYNIGDMIESSVGDMRKIVKKIPVYETDYVNVVDRYATGLAHSTATYYAYGKGSKNVNRRMRRLAEGIAQETGDNYYEKWALRAMESQVYGEQQGIISKTLRPITRWSAIAGLSFHLSGLKNAMLGNVQNATVFTSRELFKMFNDRGLNPFGENWKNEKQFAESLGVTYVSAHDLYLDTKPMSGFAKRWLPNLGLMRTTEMMNGTISQAIGPFALETHISNLAGIKRPNTKGLNPLTSVRVLKDVFKFDSEAVNDMVYRYRRERRDHIKVHEDNGKSFKMEFTENELKQSRQQSHIVTQGVGDQAYLPYWMGRGWAKPLTLFYRVAYRITNTVGNHVIKPIIMDGNMVPAMKYTFLTTASGMGLYAAYDFLFDIDRVNRFKDTPSQLLDSFIKAEGFAMFSNGFNEYGGWEEAYYPVPLRNITTVIDNMVDVAQGKKFGTTAFGDGMKEIVAIYGASEKLIKKATGNTVKKFEDSKRRQSSFLKAFYPKERPGIDYDDGLTTKSPHYRAMRDVFWHDDPSRIAQSYYVALAFVRDRLMSDEGFSHAVAEKKARERLKRIVSSLRPVPKSWYKTIGRTGKTKYMEYVNVLSDEDRAKEEFIDNLYHQKHRDFYKAISKYRNVFYKASH